MTKKPKLAKVATPKVTGTDELNGYQAAALVGMSPTLLRWFSGHAPKKNSQRKLKVRFDGEVLYVERQELIDFNTWLKLPWGVPGDPRPAIPSGIRKEIKVEANGKCAICQQHGDTCEAAHLEPVATTRNNHPENLLWLCANHHSAYDKTTYGPKDENAAFVGAFKQIYASYKRLLWRHQAEISGTLHGILKSCEALKGQLDASTTPEQRNAVEALAVKFLAVVPKAAPVSEADPGFAAFKAMKPKFSALSLKSTASKDLSATLGFAAEVRTEFAAKAGYETCPLCQGAGTHDGEDCPECGGQGELTTSDLRRVDMSRYDVVNCPLCGGGGVFEGDDCRPCQGDGRMERRFADQVDVREWEDVDCPVCGGDGRLDGDDCPPCGAEGRVKRRDLDRIDVRDYERVDCPLCDDGTFEGNDCPECGGAGDMQRQFVDRVDVRRYSRVDCPLCEGSGSFDGADCRVCDGERKVERRHADEFNRRDYDMVKCPSCSKRPVEYCPDCGDEGQMRRWQADRIF